MDYLVDVSTTIATLVVLFLKYYDRNKHMFGLLIGVLVLLHVGQIIKLRSDDRTDAEPKPWEKILKAMPIDFKSNVFIDAIDPGLSYVTLLIGISYALFGLNHVKISEKESPKD